MASPAAVLSILVTTNSSPAVRGLMRVNAQLGSTEARGQRVARTMERVALKTALIGGTAVVGGLVYATKKAADFEQQLSSLGSVADANARQMEQFRKQALRAGADTKFSALEAARAQTELAKGGLTVQQIMRGGLRSALALAAAGEMELADAAAATVNAMKLFNLRGRDSMKVADAFATAANRTTADVSDFAMALRQGGSAAKAAGLTFVETTAFLESLAEAGIKNSDAGTSMKAALLQLASPTEKAAGVMDQLGLKFFDANGEMRSLVDISRMLRDRLGGLTREQRVQAATTLVGTDGMRALLALYDAGPKKIAGFERGLNKQGTAAEVAKRKQDNLAGSLEQLQGSVETLAIQIGTSMIPTIRKGADELTGLANDIGRIIERDDLTLGEKLQQSIDLAKVRADPWVDKLEAAIDEANIPDRLADVISKGTPIVVEAMAKAGLASVKTFAGAFAESDVWGKLVLGGWLLARMGGRGAWFKMGATAGGSFGSGIAAGAAGGGLLGKLKGGLKGLGGLAGRLAALDVAINLVDSKGNPIAAAINTAHDLTFGIVPKVKLPTGGERAQASVEAVGKELDAVTKKRDVGGIERVADKIRAMADEARRFGRQDLGEHLDALADRGENTASRLGEQQHKVARMSDQFAANLRGLRLKGGKSFDELTKGVVFGSKQILRVGGKNSEKTREEISRQFRIARDRVREAMRDKIISVKEGTRRLHDLAKKELGLYGISAGRVNVVLAKGANGQMRPTQTGGYLHGGAPVGDSIPVLAERGEYVLNRKAVQKVGRDKLDRINYAVAPRFQRGGMIDPAWDPGGERLNAAISGKVGQWARRYQANMTAGYDPGGGHVSPGHNVTGTATDMVPLSGNWDLLEKGLRVLVGAGLKVLYGSNGVGTPWPNHGRGNHAHIEWGGAGGIPSIPMFDGLPRVALKGPASVALEAGQGALDRIRGAANAAIERAITFSTEASERGSNVTGGFGKGALRRLWVQAGGPPGIANLMAAIALAESGGDPNIRNPSGASGLWQILGEPFPGNVFDPLTNARMAVSKYGSQGLGAWEAYTNGAYRQFLQRGGLVGMQAGGGLFGGVPAGGSLFGKIAQNVARFGGQYGAGSSVGGLGLGKALHKVQFGKTPQLRKAGVRRLLDRIKGVGLPDSLQDRLEGLSRDAGIFAESANIAGQLTVESSDGTILPGIVGGKNQIEWLTAQLETLFKWRNALLEAHEIIVARREKITATIEAGKSRLQSMRGLDGRLADAQKHPKRNKALIQTLKGQLRVRNTLRDTILPALRDKRGGLNTARGDLLSSLEEVQGVGAPMQILPALPGIGVLRGQIFDVQNQLRELSAPAASVIDSDAGGSGRADALAELLRESNLRYGVLARHFDVLRNMPPYGGQFAAGGVVAGPPGAPRTVVAHGGEIFAGTGGIRVIVHGDIVSDRRDPVEVVLGDRRFKVEVERAARGARVGKREPLPGRGGGGIR